MDRPSRRQFLQGSLALAGLGLLSGCGMLPPQVQQSPKIVKLGLLSAYSLDPSPESTALRQALRDLGYVEGQSLTIVPRFGAGKEALASRAVELVGLKPDAILVAGDDPARAARDATDAIPIVMADSSDPVGDGLIAGLARPGGNVTGLTSLATLLRAKR